MDTTKIQELVSGDAAVKMRVLRLRQLLQELIGVDGDPIENHRKAKAYVCQFEIRLAGDDGFRTPAGVTWLDLAFHERVDGRILVTVPERQQFRARGAQNRSGESVGEVAEERGTVTRTYSLEEMGLRTEAGQLTSEARPSPTCSVPVVCSRAAATTWWCSNSPRNSGSGPASTVNLSDCSKPPGRGRQSSRVRARSRRQRALAPLPASVRAPAGSIDPRAINAPASGLGERREFSSVVRQHVGSSGARKSFQQATTYFGARVIVELKRCSSAVVSAKCGLFAAFTTIRWSGRPSTAAKRSPIM